MALKPEEVLNGSVVFHVSNFVESETYHIHLFQLHLKNFIFIIHLNAKNRNQRAALANSFPGRITGQIATAS